MRRLLSVCLLILCLSLPAIAGHQIPGFGWCSCSDPASHYQGMRIDEDDIQHNEDADVSELETLLNTLSMWLRVSL